MLKFNVSGDEKEAIKALTGKKIVCSDEEYVEFCVSHSPPSGWEWCRTPFGASPGCWVVYCKRETTPKVADTSLEKQTEAILEELGLKNRFEKQFPFAGFKIDFADEKKQIALEPGAIYYHTPEGIRGEGKEKVGYSPDEVYFPVRDRDTRKQTNLSRLGWTILWISEEAFRGEGRIVREEIKKLYF